MQHGASDSDAAVRVVVARHSSVDRIDAAALARDESREVRAALAANRATPTDVRAELFTDPTMFTVHDRHAPPSAIGFMLANGDQETRARAILRGSAPADAHLELPVRALREPSAFLGALAEHEQVEALSRLARSVADAAAATTNWDAVLRCDRQSTLRSALAQHSVGSTTA